MAGPCAAAAVLRAGAPPALRASRARAAGVALRGHAAFARRALGRARSLRARRVPSLRRAGRRAPRAEPLVRCAHSLKRAARTRRTAHSRATRAGRAPRILPSRFAASSIACALARHHLESGSPRSVRTLSVVRAQNRGRVPWAAQLAGGGRPSAAARAAAAGRVFVGGPAPSRFCAVARSRSAAAAHARGRPAGRRLCAGPPRPAPHPAVRRLRRARAGGGGAAQRRNI
jgi:hypothetical protein